MKAIGIFGGLLIVALMWFGFYELMVVPEPDDDVHLSEVQSSKQYIQEKCGVLGSDLMWTTAMDKIAKCIKDKEEYLEKPSNK